jgi:hypothetical protein
MIRRALLSSLSELPQPVLTAYLDTNPGGAGQSANHTPYGRLQWNRSSMKLY